MTELEREHERRKYSQAQLASIRRVVVGDPERDGWYVCVVVDATLAAGIERDLGLLAMVNRFHGATVFRFSANRVTPELLHSRVIHHGGELVASMRRTLFGARPAGSNAGMASTFDMLEPQPERVEQLQLELATA